MDCNSLGGVNDTSIGVGVIAMNWGGVKKGSNIGKGVKEVWSGESIFGELGFLDFCNISMGGW